jgi:hypothetical protein
LLAFKAPPFFSEIRFDVAGAGVNYNPVLGHSPAFTWPSQYVYRWDNVAQKYTNRVTHLQTGTRGPFPGFISVGNPGDPPAGPQPSPTNQACMTVVGGVCSP